MILSATFGLTIGIVAAEICLRTVGIGMPMLYAADEFCGSRLRPSTSGVWTKEGNAEVRVNSLGFRSAEFSVQKPANVFRIAVLGDSFVEAMQVDVENTFCCRLEQQLNQANTVAHRTYQVINCGVSGYGTAQELQMLQHHVLPLNPDAVMLAVFPENDVRNNSRTLEGDPARPYFTVGPDKKLTLDNTFQSSAPYQKAMSVYEQRKAAWVNGFRILQALKHIKQNGLNAFSDGDLQKTIQQELSDSVSNAAYVYSPSQNTEHVAAWNITRRLVQEVVRVCNDAQVKVFVFTVSSPIQVYPDSELRSQVANDCGIDDLFYSEQQIAELLQPTEAHFLPLASRLQQYADQEDVFLHGFSNTLMGTGHWNKQGHAVVGAMLADWLSELGLAKPND